MTAPRDVEARLPTGLRIAGRAWGPDDGTPVLATHGWLDNAATYDALLPLLTEARPDLCVWAWDAAGHGHSGHRRSAYHFVDYVADAIHLMDTLGSQTWHLLGHSMGAGIATLVAGTVPDRVASAVFLEGFGPLSQPDEQAPPRLARAIVEERKRGQRGERGARRYREFDAAVAKRAEVGAMTRESARRLVERATERDETGFTWRSDPALRTSSRQYFAESTILAYFRRIACPCLLVRAKSGWPADAETMRTRGEAVSTLEQVTVPGHHHVHLDAPETVAPAILDFWTRAIPRA